MTHPKIGAPSADHDTQANSQVVQRPDAKDPAEVKSFSMDAINFLPLSQQQFRNQVRAQEEE